MPMLKLLVDKNLKEKKFFEKIKERSKKSDLVKNPFTTKIKFISSGDKMLVLLDIEPMYPDTIPKFGVFGVIIGLVFNLLFLVLFGFFMLSWLFFWSPEFYFLVLKKARKKEGIKGEIKMLNNKEAFKEVFEAWDK